MNENSKTGIFAGALVVTVLAWFVTFPRTYEASKASKKDDRSALFESYDPLQASVMKIVKYDDTLGEISDFEIAKEREVWTIPSHGGYPADATKQMSEVASLFIDLVPLAQVTEVAKEHEKYGVIEPDREKLQEGETGVGTLVRIQNEAKDNIVNLIIGKAVKDKPTQRFVRKPGQDMVYLVELKTDSLTNDFSKWIESDLLKLSSTDIQNIAIQDYTIVPNGDGTANQNKVYDANVAFSNTDGKWNAEAISIYKENVAEVRTVGDDEQLNTTKLNDLRSALDSLRIADVSRKPAGLAADLKVEKSLMDDRDSYVALVRKGFIPQTASDGTMEMFATNGELTVTLRDGVQYLIRFGNSTGVSSDEKKEDADGSKSSVLDVDRYMLVMTKVDESKFPPVTLKTLPETYEDLLRMEAPPTPTNPVSPLLNGEPIEIPAVPAGEAEKAPEPTAEPAAEEKKDEGSKEPGASDQSSLRTTDAKQFVSLQQQPPEENSEKKDAAPEVANDANAPQAEAAQPPADQPPVAVPAPAKPESQEPPALTDEEKKERLESVREKITKENQRMIDDRNDKLDAARKKVAELNARFSDWFYVIGEKEYKRLRIPVGELIQPKSAAPAPAAPNFNPGGGFPGFPGNQ